MSFSGKDDFLRRARERLFPPYSRMKSDLSPMVPGDGSGLPITRLREASVLMGLIDKGEDMAVIFTQRPATMKAHPGQIAFPGGKVDNSDRNAADTALREAEEEIGAPREQVELIGQAPPMRTLTGFSISLFVGLLPDDFEPLPCPREVDEVFETPLSFLMSAENHQKVQAEIAGRQRSYYAMPHNGRYIWGVTAGMIKDLYDRLYLSPDQNGF